MSYFRYIANWQECYGLHHKTLGKKVISLTLNAYP